MYFKERKMEQENQYFIYRVGQLPLVKAAYDSATNVYTATKNYNSLLNATLQMAENSVKYASEVEGVKKVLHNPLVSIANNIAVSQLDKLEQKYPSIKKTPDQLLDAGKEYYEHSSIKGGLDKVSAAKEYSVAKADDTKKYCQSILAGDVTVFDAFTDASRLAMIALNGVMDYSDAFIDKYIAVEGASTSAGESMIDMSCVDRVHLMSNKAYNGMKHHTAVKYVETKEYVLKTMGDLQTAMILLEYAKNTGAWVNEKAHSTVSAAQEQAQNMWIQIQNNAETLGKRSEVIVLHLVQNLAVGVSSLSDQIAKYATPYLPEGVEKKMTAAANYAHEMKETFSKAKTLGDLRDEVIAEAKVRIVVMRDGLVDAIDHVVDFPPVSWLVCSYHQLSVQTGAIAHRMQARAAAGLNAATKGVSNGVDTVNKSVGVGL